MSKGMQLLSNPNILMNKSYQIDGGGQFAATLVPSPHGMANSKEISNANAQCSVDFTNTAGIDFVRVNPKPLKAHRYLPYEQNGLTYLTLDAGARLFLTGPINGCHIFVTQGPAGGVTVMHVNWNQIATNTPAGVIANRNQKFLLANNLRTAMGAPAFSNVLVYQPEPLVVDYHSYLGFAVGRKKTHAAPWEFFVYGIGGLGAPRILRQF
jgi:hypothetical protein